MKAKILHLTDITTHHRNSIRSDEFYLDRLKKSLNCYLEKLSSDRYGLWITPSYWISAGSFNVSWINGLSKYKRNEILASYDGNAYKKLAYEEICKKLHCDVGQDNNYLHIPILESSYLLITELSALVNRCAGNKNFYGLKNTPDRNEVSAFSFRLAFKYEENFESKISKVFFNYLEKLKNQITKLNKRINRTLAKLSFASPEATYENRDKLIYWLKKNSGCPSKNDEEISSISKRILELFSHMKSSFLWTRTKSLMT